MKDGGSLGFSIIGGTDHSCVPFGGGKAGIFISHVMSIIYLALFFLSKLSYSYAAHHSSSLPLFC